MAKPDWQKQKEYRERKKLGLTNGLRYRKLDGSFIYINGDAKGLSAPSHSQKLDALSHKFAEALRSAPDKLSYYAIGLGSLPRLSANIQGRVIP